ncbi:SHOCT domain-containing protein [Cellulosimicrobium sp. E-16]|uniref:SHOCT domain-containing protein n=1 Tax=Cellulosimicrobium sp. E-16 TaxID=3404049 RepID=UPI003CFAFE10
MPGLIRGVARTAVVAGTATAVSNRVSRRQAGRWAAQESAPEPQYAAPPQQYAAPQPTYSPPPAPAPAASPDMDARIAQLTQLAALRDQGVLSPAEFEAQKARILAD